MDATFAASGFFWKSPIGPSRKSAVLRESTWLTPESGRRSSGDFTNEVTATCRCILATDSGEKIWPIRNLAGPAGVYAERCGIGTKASLHPSGCASADAVNDSRDPPF